MIPRFIEPERLKEYQIWYSENQTRLEAHFKQFLMGVVQKKSRPPDDPLVIYIGTQDPTTKSKWIDEKDLQDLRYYLTNNSQLCGYCEQGFTVGVHLDHFLPKSKFPKLTFDIHNLVPCCFHCNAVKGAHVNGKGKEILNPYTDCPKDELVMDIESLKLKGRGSLGKTTVKKLGNSLNAITYIGDNYEEVKGANLAREALREAFLLEFEGSEDKRPEVLKRYLKIHLENIAQKELSATRASLLCDGPEFRSLVEALRDKDPRGAEEIDLLMEEKRQYSLFQTEGPSLKGSIVQVTAC